jgi:ascorbate-specific PTS system EIIC-type component UlaA
MPALIIASVLDKEHLFDHWRGPLLALFVGGFIIAVLGHLTQFKTLIVTGIVLVFLAILIFPIILYAQGSP